MPSPFRSWRSALSSQTTCSRLKARGYRAPGWHLAFPTRPNTTSSYQLTGYLARGSRLAIEGLSCRLRSPPGARPNDVGTERPDYVVPAERLGHSTDETLIRRIVSSPGPILSHGVPMHTATIVLGGRPLAATAQDTNVVDLVL